MLGDKERSGAYASEQRRLVRASLAAEVLTFTPYWRDAADAVGMRRPTTSADLRPIPPRPLAEMRPPDALVLRPSLEAVRRRGPRVLRRRVRRARLRHGRTAGARLVLDPLYTPLHWLIEDETPVGCTEADLVRLGEIGRRSLEMAGVTRNDAIVSLVPTGPTLSSWQLALGAREAMIPLAGLGPSASIESVTLLGPTVLAGQPADLLRVLDGLARGVRGNITTVLVVTRAPLHRSERSRLERALGDQAVLVEMWSPPGVRALWSQCRGGEGIHTWPQTELLEVCGPDGDEVAAGDEGELVWTGLGWRGTVLVRLATGVRGRLTEERCGTCGRTTPRILDAHVARGRVLRDVVEPLVEAPTPTGGIESVRTVRTPRRRKVAPPAPAAEPLAGVSQAAGNGATAPPAAEPVAPELDGVVRAVAREEPAGVVRAVAKDDSDEGLATSPAPSPAAARSAIGDTGNLPPVPGVGPDVGGAAPEDDAPERWLPDTGEVDAWPAPVLASVDGLSAWQVEHRRRRGHDELVVHLALAEGAELGQVLVALERSIGATQYVVAGEAEIAARVAAAAGRRVVDRRAPRSGNGSAAGRSAGTAPPPARDG